MIVLAKLKLEAVFWKTSTQIGSPQSNTEFHGVWNNPADEEKEKNSVELCVLRGKKSFKTNANSTFASGKFCS